MLTSCLFSTAQIKRYQNPHLEPEEIIEEFFDGTRTDAPLLKSETITAYIPTIQVKKIDKVMEVTRTQSQYVSKNKLNSATRILSIMLSDWLTLCLKAIDGQAKNKKPQIELHKSMDEKQYTRLLEKEEEEDDRDFNWYPECISNEGWDTIFGKPI
jgi:hypothetical protein